MISLKTILIFPKNFLNFQMDMIEKQGIKNLSSYSSKSCSSVVLGDSEVSLSLGIGRCSFSSISLLYFCCLIEEVRHQISMASILQEVFH